MIGKFGKANLTKQIICSKTKNMKKQLLVSVSILTFVLIQMCPSFLFSQAPQALKYQSIIRNINGTPMSNTNIGIRASVHEGSATGLSVYQESHASTTNQFGLINLEIGNGTSITGNFSSIAWSTGTKWMEIEADFGSGYISMGTSQLLSVPFALNFVPGPAGENGTNGVDGLNGTNGVDGIDGVTGQNGIDGTNGTSGVAGLNGTNGADGIDGVTGQNGIDGTNGTNGNAGLNGTNGVDGIDGATGQNGIDGVNGTNGVAGLNGTNGVDGIDGATGQNGIDGINGTNGNAGLNGTNGADGIDGATGQNGIDGTNGTNGNAGLNGANGVDGIDGATGQNGIDGVNGTNGVAGLNGTNGVDGIDGINGTNGVNGIDGTNGTNGIDGLNGTNGVNGIDGATGQTGSISQFAMFFGLTAGTGNGAGTDYSSTIAVKSGAGTGRFPFPQDGPTAGIARVNTTSFTLPTIGTYEIYFSVHTTEAGQIQLELDGVDLPETVAANMNATAGGHLITGTFFVTTSLPNAILAVINPSGNAAALTITPADGASTHANAQVLTIKKIF